MGSINHAPTAETYSAVFADILTSQVYFGFGPIGTPMANGNSTCYIDQISVYLSGRAGSVTARAYFNEDPEGPITQVALNVSPDLVSFPVGIYTDNMTGFRYGFTTDDAVNFKLSDFEAPNEGTSSEVSGMSWPQSLAVYLTWTEAHSAPVPVGVDQATPSSLRARFTISEGSGVAPLTGGLLQCSTSDQFPEESTRTVSSLGESVITDLNPGTTYYFRAAARDHITDNEGTTSEWSDTFSGSTVAAVPGPTQNGKAVTVGTYVYYLTWDPPGRGAPITGYEIGASFPDGGGIFGYVDGDTYSWTSPEFSEPALMFRVGAVNATGSGISVARDFVPDAPPSGMAKVHIDGSFVPRPMKVYNGTSWETKPVKVYRNGSWILAG